jgi:hypothetical protein
MSKMNWKGWLLLAGLVVGALGFAAWKFGGDYLQDARLESYAVQVENAANHKFDVLDIEISELAGVKGKVLWVYLESEGQTAAPLTEREFEAVDVVFMDLVEYSDSEVVIWAWAQDLGGDYYITVFTACESLTVLANRDNPEVQAKCQTQQTMQPMEAKHLRWKNE